MINTGEREAENNQSHILTPTYLGTDNKQVITFFLLLCDNIPELLHKAIC